MEDKLDLILDEIKNLNNKIAKIEDNMPTKQELENTTEKISGITSQVAHVQEDITVIKNGVNRIEQNEPQDVMALLNNIDTKLDNKDSDILALNKRLFQVESTLERITNQ